MAPMHASTRRHLLLFVVLALALIAPGRAPAAPPSPGGAAPSAANDVYLPLLTSGTVPFEFALEIDDFGEPIDPTTTFQAGITQFYASVRVRGQSGQRVRVNYVRPSGRGGSLPTTITSESQRVTVPITSGDDGPLETGNYTFTLELTESGSVYASGVATIQ